LENPGIEGRILLRRIFRKCDVGAWTGSSWFRIGTVGENFKCGNEPLGFLNCGEFLD
jgi:hypothetical protein